MSARVEDSCYACGAPLLLPVETSDVLSASAAGRVAFEDRVNIFEAERQTSVMDRGIADLDEHIARTQSRLDRLKHDRHVLSASRGRLQNMELPISRLPAEMLSECFCIASCNQQEDIRFDLTPFNLSHVCSHWRSTALSTARLWSTISIGSRFIDSIERQIPLTTFLRIMLQRSGESSIDISWNTNHWGTSLLPVIWDILASASRRWRSANLILDEPLPELSMASIPFPSLRSVQLDGYWQSIPLFQDAPLLRKAKLLFGPVDKQVNLAWSQLTELQMHRVPAGQFLAIVSQCTSLRRCSAWFGLYTGSLTPVFHHALQSLSLHFSVFVDNDVNTFTSLTAPALTDLVTKCLTARGIRAVVDFVQRSNCNLEVLTLNHHPAYTPPSADNVLALLRCTPSLIALRVQTLWTTRQHVAFLQGLTLSTLLSCDDIVPRLSFLSSSAPDNLMVPDGGALNAMLESRLSAGGRHCLQTYDIVNRELREDLRPQIQLWADMWRARGLEMTGF